VIAPENSVLNPTRSSSGVAKWT